jgi:hypothetical protein
MEQVRIYLPAVFLAPIALMVALSLVFWAKLTFAKLRTFSKTGSHVSRLTYPPVSVED